MCNYLVIIYLLFNQHNSMNYLKLFLMPNQDGSMRIDFLSGLTVALALVPEAVAFSLVAGVNPSVGLWGAFFMCLITAIIGGRPGMISGATGSMAVVMISIMALFPGDTATGLSYLFMTVLLTGIFEVLIGVFGLGKFIRMMPKSVMIGFVNGLAIVIFISQLHSFKLSSPVDSNTVWLQGDTLWVMLVLVILSMAITHYLPKITKAPPSALSAIIVVTLIAWFAPMSSNINLPTVGSLMAHSGGDLSHFFSTPSIPFSMDSIMIIVPYAFILAIIGLSESLMTLLFIDERTNTRGHGNKECIAQGIANIASSFFKGMGGCAMIGQSMINISSGGRGRLSGITAGSFLLIFILLAMPLIKLIPLAALVGVMFMVVYETFEWATFKMIKRIPLSDFIIIIAVTVTTIFFNLAVAVIVGIIIASLVFAWKTAKNITIESKITDMGAKEYIVHGPLFFSSTTTFKDLFDFHADPEEIIIDFKYSRVADQSAIDAIQWVSMRYIELGKQMRLRHLNQECKKIIRESRRHS